jgi:hypothetical protein
MFSPCAVAADDFFATRFVVACASSFCSSVSDAGSSCRFLFSFMNWVSSETLAY